MLYNKKLQPNMHHVFEIGQSVARRAQYLFLKKGYKLDFKL